MKPSDKLQRAKIALVLDEPFFGALLLGLKVVEDKSGTVTKTCATNGESLWWHGPFLDKLSERELKTILAHEALHAALLHPLRRGAQDNGQWNIACDHAVNLHLEDCNAAARAAGKPEPFPWPALDIYKDPQFAGKSAEEIYNALAPQNQTESENDQQSGGKGSPSDQQGMGGVLDAPGDEASQQEQEAGWQVALVQAAQAAKQAGQLPAGMARLVQETINPPARWQDLLRAFVRESAKDDYSWTRPNSRYAHTGFILPSLYSQRLGKIAVAIDTSGSIDHDLLNTFLGEVESICSECRPSGITLIDCDTEIGTVRECEPTEPLPRDFAGGGGTDFKPVFERLANDNPVCLIYFTDLEGEFPKSEPAFPTLWASYHTEKSAPFGVTVKLQ
jgi:predicted metal-dependent peptidase